MNLPHLLFIDLETFYDTADNYTLSRGKLSMSEYIRDPRFKSFGAALAFGNEKAKWLNHEQLVEEFKTVDWSKVAVVSHNCLPLDAEVYTRDGWKSLQDVCKFEEIMIWNPENEEAEFSPVNEKFVQKADEMYVWKSNFHKGAYTANHRMFYKTPRDKQWRVASAEEVSQRGQNNMYIPVSGLYDSGFHTAYKPRHARLIEAVRADATLNRNHIQFHLKKKRKIRRLKEICAELQIGLHIQRTKLGTYRIGLYENDQTEKVIKFFADGKKYTRDILTYPLDFRQEILKETKYWDGSTQTKYGSCQVSTICDETAQAFELMAHFSGWSCSRRKKKNHNGWGTVSKDLNYVTLRPREKVKLLYKPTKQKGSFDVGCVNVKTGAFFYRYKGQIAVTGNSKFDHSILVWRYGINPALFLDTLSMARAVIGTKIQKFSLASLADYYGLEPKGHLHTDGLLTLSEDQERELGEYCEHDTNLCQEIFYKMLPEFPESQFFQMDWTIRAFVYPKLRLDTKLLGETAIKERKRRETIFQEIGIDKKTFSSNEKFADLLRKEGFDVPVKKSPSTGEDIPAFALGDEGFQEMVNSDDDRLADLCEARIAAKSNLLETRSEKLRRVGAYGPFPVDIQFSGALQTHRASGGNGSGGNFQNFTKGSALRQAVTVEEGWRLVVADEANIEFRIVSYLSQDPILVGMIENGVDMYCDFASKIYKRPIVKGDKERVFGKTAILGLGYGMGWEKFKRTVKKDCKMDIDDSFAKETVYFYRGYYKGVPALWEKLDYVLDHMQQGGRGTIFGSPAITYDRCEIALPSGLRLRYPNLRLENEEFVYTAYRQGKSEAKTVKIYGGKLLENISQALAGEILKEAMKRIEDKKEVILGVTPSPLVNAVVHDEALVAVPVDKVKLAKHFIKEAMTNQLSWWPEIKLDAEVGDGTNWLEGK